jgi:hypothetical protein
MISADVESLTILKEKCSCFYQDLLGYFPQKTKLKIIKEENWQEFLLDNSYSLNCSGIYNSRSQTAIIPDNNPLSLFHEYFGHGLYYERTREGVKLVNLEKELLKSEQEEFQNKNFTLDELNNFRKSNKTFEKIVAFYESNKIKYELFAIWSEYFLSKKMGCENIFEERAEKLPFILNQAVNDVIEFSHKYGNLATFYAFELEKFSDIKRAETLLKDILKEDISSVKFGVLFGSRKPFSDMDIYLVSDEISPFHSEWIDIRIHSMKRFEEGLKNFDFRVSDPLFSGEFIFGDKYYFNQVREQLLIQPITKEAIEYNYKKSESYKNQEKMELCDRAALPETYVKSYSLNAQALEKGIKLFTYENIKSFSHELGINCERETK